MDFQQLLVPIKNKNKINLCSENYGCVLSSDHLTNTVLIFDANSKNSNLKSDYLKIKDDASIFYYNYNSNKNNKVIDQIDINSDFDKIKIFKKETTLIMSFEYSKYITNMKKHEFDFITQLNIEINQIHENWYLHDDIILKKILEHFYIIHIQSNNKLPFYINKVPACFKLTLLNKNLFKNKKIYKEVLEYPISKIDFQNEENLFFHLNWWKNKKFKVNKN